MHMCVCVLEMGGGGVLQFPAGLRQCAAVCESVLSLTSAKQLYFDLFCSV